MGCRCHSTHCYGAGSQAPGTSRTEQAAYGLIMEKAAGFVLAAGGITLANEALFVPNAGLNKINWRLVPATAILATALTGLDKLAPGFGSGLAMLVLLSVLVIPFGNAPSPLENMSNALGYTQKKVL
jgi:hypothetical protein